MQERLQASPTHQPQLPDHELAPVQPFSSFLDKSSEVVPEIGENRELLETTGKELIDKYQIGEEFFGDDGRALTFTAIANRWATVERPYEKVFLEDALTLLAAEHSAPLKEINDWVVAHESDTKNYDEETAMTVYDRYTHNELTEKMRAAVNNDLLADVKESLGVTADNEDPFDLRVLSIGTEYTRNGIRPPAFPDRDSLKGSDEDKEAQNNAASAQHADFTRWSKGLDRRTEEFKQAIGQKEVAPAWINRFEKHGTVLCIPMTTAEKLLSPEITENDRYYTETDRAREIATLKHEYTHTQGGLTLNNGISFGIGLEEIRAEYFSGNKMGYQDAKAFDLSLGMITGKSSPFYFKEKIKGGDPFSVYGELASRIGLNRLLEVIMVRPNNYDADQSNLLQANIAEHLGGYDAVLNRLREDQIAAGKEAEVEERITQVAESLLKRGKEINDESLPENYFAINHMNGAGSFGADLVLPRVAELRAKERAST